MNDSRPTNLPTHAPTSKHGMTIPPATLLPAVMHAPTYHIITEKNNMISTWIKQMIKERKEPVPTGDVDDEHNKEHGV